MLRISSRSVLQTRFSTRLPRHAIFNKCILLSAACFLVNSYCTFLVYVNISSGFVGNSLVLARMSLLAPVARPCTANEDNFPDHAGEDHSSEEEGVDSDHSVASVSRWLLQACGRKKPRSLSEITSYLEQLDQSVVAAALLSSNSNEKTALHMACQFRKGSEGPGLVKTLLNHGAQIDASITRGHTPLIFAAGRGNEAIVHTLLRRGANPRIVTASGVTAAEMARNHCSPGTAYLLEVAENSETRPWQDFRENPEAVAAQAKHGRLRQHVREKREGRDPASDAAEDPGVTLQARSLAAALDKGMDVGREGLVSILVHAFRNRKIDTAAAFVLQRAFQEVFSTGDRSSLLTVLRVCHEDELGHALSLQGVRDRRALQMVFASFFTELEKSGHRLLDDTPAADIVAASTSLHLVLETLRLKKSFDPAEDCQTMERIWRKAFFVFTSNANGWVSDVIVVTGLQLSKKNGGSRMAELLILLRWAMAVQSTVPTWHDMVTDICLFAADSHFGSNFVQVAKSALKPLPVQVEKIIEGTLKVSCQALELPQEVMPTTSSSGSVGHTKLPDYILTASTYWVSDDDSMRDIRRALEHAVESSGSEEPVLVGMDTEWGELASGDPDAAPSVVQIAAVGKVWILDTASPGPQARSLIRWIADS
ncbi:unnamed protein product [Prorocentrum cordatum]|uniref:Uncharacterized protein n=1 Tax=Prorocentrum cordatum TaxID=2364126 RepID=A0ABN9VK99_9DINO|nr:unnamed protein product [Polarella glacialis]